MADCKAGDDFFPFYRLYLERKLCYHKAKQEGKAVFMHIRLAQKGDIPGIQTLLLQVGEVHHQIRPDIFRTGALKYTPQELEDLLSDPARPIFVAMEGEVLLGYAFCVHRDYDGTGVSTCRKEIYVDDVCVDEGHRGQGVATALLDYVFAYAKEKGCQFVTLNVWEGNGTAQRFYQGLGMTPRNTNMEIKL